MKSISLKACSMLMLTVSILSSEFYITQAIAAGLTLQQAENLALKNEPGMLGLQANSEALLSRSIAEGQLMDPKLQVGLVNLPTDTFDLDQEPMTQLKLSYIQQFPAGDTLDLKQQKAEIKSQQFTNRLAERRLDILRQVRMSYLEMLYWEQAKQTLRSNLELLSQLVEVVQSLFAVGRTSQLDVLSAQLELSKLEDRQARIEQNISTHRLKLSQWVGIENSQLGLDDNLPDYLENQATVAQSFDGSDLIDHPKVLEINTTLEMMRKDIQIVDESAKPGWNLNVSYGFREDSPSGVERADFLSATVTFDLPLFTENRQDKHRLSQEMNFQAGKDQRNALLREMSAELSQLQVNRTLLNQRMSLYSQQLLPQSSQRSDAALQSYQSGKGSFTRVMQAFMDALNTQLGERRIAIDLFKTQTEILYLLGD